LILFQRKAPAVAGAFFAFLRAFLRVVLEKWVFLHGVLVVSCWWIRDESWLIDDRSVAAKNRSKF
jgi:hypothetical protein